MNKYLLILTCVVFMALSTTFVMANQDGHKRGDTDCLTDLVIGKMLGGEFVVYKTSVETTTEASLTPSKQGQSFEVDVLRIASSGCRQTRRGLRCNNMQRSVKLN